MVHQDLKRGFSFYLPEGWHVRTQASAIMLYKDRDTHIQLIPLVSPEAKIQPERIVDMFHKKESLRRNDLFVLGHRCDPDINTAEMLIQYTSENSVHLTALLMCRASGSRGLMVTFQSRSEEYGTVRLVLTAVLSSLELKEALFHKTRHLSPSTETAGDPVPSSISLESLVLKRSMPDGAVFGMMPPDWEFGGGLDVGVIAHDRSGNMGIRLVNIPVYSGFPSASPSDFLLAYVLPPSGLKQIEVIERKPLLEYDAVLRSQGVQSITEVIEFNAVSQVGVPLKCGASASIQTMPLMLNAEIRAAWAGRDVYDSVKAVLGEMAFSLGPDPAAVQRRIRSQEATLSHLSHTISSTGDVVISMCDSKMRDTNRIIDKLNYYQSGEQAFLSTLEDKIYVGRVEWGDYIQNPHYSQETMYTDIPADKWDSLTHTRQLLQ